ncbi:EF hand [Ulvibacter litoralis]|uniref:EF hand n=2 Tax=Ulvibacter litoralis TaxID=227084 RepID=A0A1G7EWN8_9FLAO|nr:EF hand [Ulvibacter litoralis]
MNTINFKTGIVAVAFIFFGITTSTAQSRGDKKPKKATYEQLLEKMDADEDGMLSEEEVKGRLKEQFSTIDTDEDGFISEEEFDNAPKPKRRGKKEN